jgi:hypothetical protein
MVLDAMAKGFGPVYRVGRRRRGHTGPAPPLPPTHRNLGTDWERTVEELMDFAEIPRSHGQWCLVDLCLRRRSRTAYTSVPGIPATPTHGADSLSPVAYHSSTVGRRPLCASPRALENPQARRGVDLAGQRDQDVTYTALKAYSLSMTGLARVEPCSSTIVMASPDVSDRLPLVV